MARSNFNRRKSTPSRNGMGSSFNRAATLNFRRARTSNTGLNGQPMGRTRNPGSCLKFYRGIQDKIYRYTNSCQPFNLTFNSGTGAGFGMGLYLQGQVPAVPAGQGNAIQFGFRLSTPLYQFGSAGINTIGGGLANVGEYTAMYEQFKIEFIEMEFYYANAPNVPGTAIPQVPLVCTAFDPDDMDAAGFATLQQTPTFRKIQFGNSSGSNNGKQVIRFQPAYAAQYVLQGGATVVTDNKNTWIDTIDYDTAPYYGIKMFYDNQDARAAIQYSGFATVYVKYYLAFRGPK